MERRKMTALLDPRTADRLAKLLGLLGAERATAGRMADSLVRARGLSWSEIISSTHAAAAAARSIEEQIDAALEHGEGVLNAWEEGFLRGIRGRQFLTQKQLAKLDGIVA